MLRLFETAGRWYKEAIDAGNLWGAPTLAAMYMDGEGVETDYEEAERLLLIAFAQPEQHEPPQVDILAALLEKLSSLVLVVGRFEKAEHLLQKSLLMRQGQVGLGHPSLATSLTLLAGIYSTRGQWDEAESLLRRALEITKEPKLRTMVKASLGSLYSNTGRLDDALSIFRQVSQAIEVEFGRDHLVTGLHLIGLANVLAELGRAEAMTLPRPHWSWWLGVSKRRSTSFKNHC